MGSDKGKSTPTFIVFDIQDPLFWKLARLSLDKKPKHTCIVVALLSFSRQGSQSCLLCCIGEGANSPRGAGWPGRGKYSRMDLQPERSLLSLLSRMLVFTSLMLCVCRQGSQRELLNLSQQDYVNRIEELNQSLKEAWASDQKVKALKIVIQVRTAILITNLLQRNMFTTLFQSMSLHVCVLVLQAAVRHSCDSVLPKQVCPHHRHSGHLW